MPAGRDNALISLLDAFELVVTDNAGFDPQVDVSKTEQALRGTAITCRRSPVTWSTPASGSSPRPAATRRPGHRRRPPGVTTAGGRLWPPGRRVHVVGVAGPRRSRDPADAL
ncbi:hypothetical protein GCM10018963_54710 [Saccharothrix longispora]|uniref:hypothetical protein n=1 Tax=Saccharothrix longispora TaxID=33920 RepID=UPI00286D5BC5|nr:hypothetical protein [Saccharothrix longispora]